MTRRRTLPGVIGVVEVQAARCREIAIGIRARVDGLGLFDGREKAVLLAWANSLDEIQLALSEAVRDDDQGAVRRVWRWTITAALPFIASNSIMGVGTGAALHFIDNHDPVVACAQAMVSDGYRHLNLIDGISSETDPATEDWRGDPSVEQLPGSAETEATNSQYPAGHTFPSADPEAALSDRMNQLSADRATAQSRLEEAEAAGEDGASAAQTLESELAQINGQYEATADQLEQVRTERIGHRGGIPAPMVAPINPRPQFSAADLPPEGDNAALLSDPEEEMRRL